MEAPVFEKGYPDYDAVNRKTVSILNRNNGMVWEMTFENEQQLTQWLKLNTLFECLGELQAELPTRHVRMQNKEDDEDNDETTI